MYDDVLKCTKPDAMYIIHLKSIQQLSRKDVLNARDRLYSSHSHQLNALELGEPSVRACWRNRERTGVPEKRDFRFLGWSSRGISCRGISCMDETQGMNLMNLNELVKVTSSYPKVMKRNAE